MKQYRTYTIRLFPNKEQIAQLQELSIARNMLYNILIDIENETYASSGKIKTEYDLDKDITILRQSNSVFAKLNAKASQRIAKEIYGSYKSFFNLIKKDKTSRPPHKIDDVYRFHTIVYNQSGWKFISNTEIKLNGIALKYKGIPSINYTSLSVKEVKLKLINEKYLLDLGVENTVTEPSKINADNKVLAIDLGIKNLVNGIDNDGRWITLPNKAKKINDYFRKQISSVQSKMDKCTKGSKRYNKLRKTKKNLYNRKNGQVKQTLHIQSKKLANMNYKTIVVGDLTVKKLMGKKSNKFTKTSRSFSESAISTFMGFLSYKCQARNTEVETIGEQWTTQQNCLTGKLFKEKIELSDRTARLNDSIEIDRDLNAAINILKRYEQNHLALLTAPLDVSSVVNKYNLLTNTCS
jgi:putative transposase